MKCLLIDEATLGACPLLDVDICMIPYQIKGAKGTSWTRTLSTTECMIPRQGDVVRFPVFPEGTGARLMIGDQYMNVDVNGLVLPLTPIQFHHIRLEFAKLPEQPVVLTYYQLYERCDLLHYDAVLTPNVAVVRVRPGMITGSIVKTTHIAMTLADFGQYIIKPRWG